MRKFGFSRGSRDRRDIRGPRKKHGQNDPKKRPQKKSRGSLRSSANYDEEEAGIEITKSVSSSNDFRKKVLSSVGLDDDSDEDVVQDEEQEEVDRRRRRKGRKAARKQKPREQRQRRSSPMREEVDECNFEDEYSLGEAGSLDSDEEGVDLLENEYCEYDSSKIEVDDGTSVRDRVVGKLCWIAICAAAAFYILYDDDQLAGQENDIDVERKEPFSFNGYQDARIPDDDDTSFTQDPFLTGDDELDFDHKRAPDVDGGEAIDGRPLQQVKSAHPKTGVIEEDRLWDDLSGYAEVSEPFDPKTQLPVLWHIPKAGGTTLQDLMAHCNGMIVANEVGGLYVSDELQVVELDNGNRYINVDVTQADGIEHAKDLGFGSSRLADVAISSRFHDEVSLFTDDAYRGKCFAMLRHPIKRSVSMFYYLKDATWEHTYSEQFINMSIEEYARSELSEDNWMVRFLTNEMSGNLYDRHIDLAKEVLSSKCLVGLLEEFSKSFKRFSQYFHWGETDFQGPVAMNNRGGCVLRVIKNPDNAHEHPSLDEGSEAWNLLMAKNQYDLQLYEHAVHLFREDQKKLVDR